MQSSLERTGWAEVSSCIHSLWVAGGGGGLVAKSCLTLAIPWISDLLAHATRQWDPELLLVLGKPLELESG